MPAATSRPSPAGSREFPATGRRPRLGATTSRPPVPHPYPRPPVELPARGQRRPHGRKTTPPGVPPSVRLRRSPSPALERPRISWRTRHHGRKGFSGERRGELTVDGRAATRGAPNGRAAARQPGVQANGIRTVVRSASEARRRRPRLAMVWPMASRVAGRARARRLQLLVVRYKYAPRHRNCTRHKNSCSCKPRQIKHISKSPCCYSE
ncbi:hypothetical protein GQ55_1G045300 [Panicum hallii var. hallii]|uniref:Uncharacterized protein n=1 Tax=Panicum hallii var. hallii TaxID=1504633 RepID=A0A2T7F280_9POAL|nr:hypothetical protein GQ55_1G045300 [Panicum hallii var. hallii]